MVNIRSKVIKAICGFVSSGCMVSNCDYIKAAPKFSVDDVKPQFEKFLKGEYNSKVDKENALLNCHSLEADNWRSIIVKDITNLANYAYYAQMALEAEETYIGKKLKAKVFDFADQIDEVNKYELSKEVYYGSKNLEILKPHIKKFMEYVDSLDADGWGVDCTAVVDGADNFLENLIFRLENIRNSGGVGQLFKSGSALHSGSWNQNDYWWKLNQPGKYHMAIGDVYKSSIIEMFTVQQNDFDNRLNEHKKICKPKPCRPTECLVNSQYQTETDAINKVFNLLLNKMYNDYFSLCLSVYGKGAHKYSIGHHLVRAQDNEKSQFESFEYEEQEKDKYHYPCPEDARFKKIGFNFHLDEKV